MRSYLIRPADPDDSERIGFVHYKAWLETYTGMLPEDYLAARSAEKSAAAFAENKCKNMVAAEADGVIVGFCGWGEFREAAPYGNMGEIYGIYLLNECKRKHLGQKMIEYALEQLKISGYHKVGLWVLAANKNAISFYEKQGFAYSGISKKVSLGETVVERLYIKSE